jgi:hypothetical protein
MEVAGTSIPPNLSPKFASQYLREQHGIGRKPSTLAVLRSTGGGPRFCRDGRVVLYPIAELDRWAKEQLTEPVATTAELTAVRCAKLATL